MGTCFAISEKNKVPKASQFWPLFSSFFKQTLRTDVCESKHVWQPEDESFPMHFDAIKSIMAKHRIPKQEFPIL